VGKTLECYIMNKFKKPNRVLICKFFVQVELLNSYLKMLQCLYCIPKDNQATKQVLSLDNADLTTHLLCTCPAKCQTQYDLMKNTTLVSTRALLLVIKNIENNAKRDAMPPNVIKLKGADGKCKMESMDSPIQRNPRSWAGPRNTVWSARSMVGQTRVTLRAKTVLLSRRTGMQVSLSLRKWGATVQIMLRFSEWSWRKHSASSHTSWVFCKQGVHSTTRYCKIWWEGHDQTIVWPHF
jgi:hypothetical protein